MKANISMLNAMIRIICGLAGLAWATARMARKPGRLILFLIVVFSAMKVAEGLCRYCPMTEMSRRCRSMLRKMSEAKG